MRRDDSEEFAAFVQASQASLRRTAYLLCGDWQLASDHVQEGLIRVYVRWGRLERDGRLHSYARKAVVSAALDARRRRSSTELVTTPAATTSPAQTTTRVHTGSGRRCCTPSPGSPGGSAPAWCCATTRTCRSRRSPSCSASARAP